MQERFRGALVGLAVGDAYGAGYEGQPPSSCQPSQEIIGGGPFRLKPGQWTDDTSMTLCLAESLVETNSFDPVDQLERYCRWYREGYLSATGSCFGIGSTTTQALQSFERTQKPYCGPTDPRMAGNGSLMRVAPVPLFLAGQPAEAIERAGESSRTTHGARNCVDACRYMAALILGALQGVEKELLLGDSYTPVEGHWQQYPLAVDIQILARGAYCRKNPPLIRGGGYVVESLEAALWAFSKGNTFAECLQHAVALGEDADSTGAICGQLAGAYYGFTAIPARWREVVAKRELLVKTADALYKLANVSDS
jgi:ADP-ribosylglycohydrolase